MKFTITQIAALLGGEVQGDGNLTVDKLAKIDEQAPEGSICFLANPKYEHFIYNSTATAVIVKRDFQPKKEIQPALILVDDPYTAFTALLEEYNKYVQIQNLSQYQGIEQPSFIGENAQLGENVYVGAFAYIGKNCQIGENVKIFPQTYIGNNVVIGEHTVIHPGVKIYENTEIGKGCTLMAGAVIGSEGFGFAPQKDGTFKSIPQLGKVILQDNVCIGANTTIDRATIGNTLIAEGVKLDNLIQVAHNVVIGKNTVIAAQTGISGSTKIGENCMIAGQVGIVGHLEIANRTQIGGQSGIGKSVKQEGVAIQGIPAFEHKGFMKSSVIFRKLPELLKRIEVLEKKTTK
jgi:UDP-3-O-[3-hydroxymyristoyl] glucosamine N-acyltransferase